VSASGAVLHFRRQLDDEGASAVLAPRFAAQSTRLDFIVMDSPLVEVSFVENVVVRGTLLLSEVGAV